MKDSLTECLMSCNFYTVRFPEVNTDLSEREYSPAAQLATGTTQFIDLEPQYVTGLCEGAASFTYGRTARGIRLRFIVKLPRTQKDLVFSLQRFFGVGAVYPNWQFCVTDRHELRRIIEHFDNFRLCGTKVAGYGIWKRIHELTESNRDANWMEIQDLASQLTSLSRNAGRIAGSGADQE